MANGPEIFAAEHERFVAFMKQYADIAISEATGNPPDTYVLTYNLRGYRPDEDGITVSRPHSISIHLPPDFPQSPPEVRALTPLYHPAVDEDSGVIDVALHWDTQPTLPELVEYIASLITGAVYHVPNPANPDAVSWYDEHLMELPLDVPSHVIPEDEDEGVGPQKEESSLGMLEVEFDPAAGMEQEIEAPNPEDFEEQIREIRELIEQNQLFILDKQLAALPPNLWFPERSEAEALIKAAKQETKRLFDKARDLEDKGDYGKAIQYAQAILERIPDHPDAKALVQRLQQSSFITDSLDDALNDQEMADIIAPGGKAKAGKKRETGPEPEAEPEKKEKREKIAWLPEDFPLFKILAAALGAGLVLWLGILFLEDRAILDRARRGIDQGRTQMQAKQYAVAKATLERTREGITGLTLLFFRKGSLIKEIDAMLASQELREGAKGLIMHRGKFMGEAEANALDDLEKLEAEARELVQQKQFDAAVRAYTKAQQRIANVALPEDTARIADIIKGLEVEKLLELAQQTEQEQELEEAMDLYKQVERRALNDAALSRQFGLRIKRHRESLEVRQAILKATKEMERGRLDSARSAFQQAELLAKSKAKSLTSQDLMLLGATRLQLAMSAVLPEAKRAFETRKWREAARLYDQALSLAEDSPPEIRQSIQDFLGQVRRTRDLARAYDTWDEAKMAAGRKDWAAAVRLEKEALGRFSSGRLAGDREFVEHRKQLESQLAEHRRELSQVELGRALERRGMDHILRNFPGFKAENLSPPNVTFLRREGSRLYYELNTMDKSQRRPTRLTMRFVYDESNGQWTLLK